VAIDPERDVTSSDSRRRSFVHDGLHLSYLDTGEDAPVLLALHGHLNEGRFIDQGAIPPGLGFRMIAPDQRGHGESDHAASYHIDEYVRDALALLDHLGIDRAVVLGHSLGGVVAYALAARAPDRVLALVVIDIGAENSGDLSITVGWPRRAPSRHALVQGLGFMGPNQAYVMREYADGWGVPWDADDMVASQQALNGDRWVDWLATSMPALLIHGDQSRNLSDEQAVAMAQRRDNTELVVLDAGHAVYIDAPEEYTKIVGDFLIAHHEGRTGGTNDRQR
jgi:esterase